MCLYSVVFQDFKIFSTTLSQNIAAGEEYNYDKLYKVLDESNIKDRVLKMENKERTYLYKDLDKSGVEISGGEAQKLALARGIYTRMHRLLFLTSQRRRLIRLPNMKIYSRFNSFVENKTAIYISHRLSSCAFCNHIAVFDNAKLIEFGTHQTLINNNGKYADLWNAQAQYYILK